MCVGLRSPSHTITLNPSDLFNSKNCRSQPTTSSTCWAPRNSPRITTCRALWLRSGSTCSLSVGGFGASRTWTHGVDPRWSYIITIYRIWYWYIHIIYIYNPTYVTCVSIIMYTVCNLCREVFLEENFRPSADEDITEAGACFDQCLDRSNGESWNRLNCFPT